MRPEKRKALEAAGWKFGDAGDFLGMSDGERQMLELRVQAARAVRRQREAMKLSQQELASRIQTSQPRMVKIEKAAKDVTLDQILRAYAAAGGTISFKEVSLHQSKARPGKRMVRKSRHRPSRVQIELIGGSRRGKAPHSHKGTVPNSGGEGS